jgi:hypothetical protein
MSMSYGSSVGVGSLGGPSGLGSGKQRHVGGMRRREPQERADFSVCRQGSITRIVRAQRCMQAVAGEGNARRALVRSKLKLEIFSLSLSYRILRRMYGALNVDKKIIHYTVYL